MVTSQERLMTFQERLMMAVGNFEGLYPHVPMAMKAMMETADAIQEIVLKKHFSIQVRGMRPYNSMLRYEIVAKRVDYKPREVKSFPGVSYSRSRPDDGPEWQIFSFTIGVNRPVIEFSDLDGHTHVVSSKQELEDELSDVFSTDSFKQFMYCLTQENFG